MADTYTEFTREGWFSRIGGSIKGILFGLVAIPVCVILLWWNEGRAVTTANSLKEGAAAVVAVAADKVDAANDKKLVHVSGEAKTEDEIEDPDFGLSVPGLKLIRHVEIYQWVENKKVEKKENVGGSEETKTTYTYEKQWVDAPVKSSEFKVPADHTNSGKLIADSGNFTPDKITLGAFEVPESLVAQMAGETALPLKDEDLADDLKDRAKVHQNTFFFGKDPAEPAIGDQKVSYEIVKPGPFSIVAAQLGSTFGDFPTKAGKPISMIESGVVSAEMMFQNAASANTIITWILRFAGFLFMTFGFMAIMRPLSVLGSVIPFIGSIIGMGTGLVSVVLAGTISLLVIAIAWIAVRPVLGITLIVLAVGGFIWMRKMAASKPAQA
jgi:hypothetical protein